MRYTQFVIKNFKGVNSATIDLSNNRILTLVGLNESGKTTILEAIDSFYNSIKGKDPSEADLNLLRPKGIDFTGNIEISGELVFENEDLEKLNKFLKESAIEKTINFPKTFDYTYRFSFETHKYKETKTTCSFAAKESGVKDQLYTSDNELWNKLVKHIKQNLMPEILFYEDFIFEIPDKIVFTKNSALNKDQNAWQLVLDDILKTVNPNFSSFQEFVANVWDNDNDTARNRISSMEKLLDTKITAGWKELFKKRRNGKGDNQRLNFKEIKILCTPDGNNLNISFKVKTESGKEFSINERSKGCKWFFSFLIFTEFRKNRTKNILFLLDEPASNLHSSAQLKILDAIGQLSDRSMVIYSTHSHHLINPLWLSGAYVVLNESISAAQLEGNMTEDTGAKITSEKYYNFVGKNTGVTQNLYYQPILERLDYAPSNIEPTPKITITEGKYDWYTLKYFTEIILKDSFEFNFYPGAGRDHHDDIIRLYLSWGKEFVLLLDGDRAGQKSKDKYLREFNGFVENKIFTIKDVLSEEKEMEDLIESGDKEVICDAAFGKGTYSAVAANPEQLKSKLNFAINQLLVSKKSVNITPATRAKFVAVLNYIKEKFPSNL